MKIPMRSILIVFVVCFFVFGLFFGFNPPSKQQIPNSFRAGRVLGVSETIASRSIDSLGYEIPEILPPEKKKSPPTKISHSEFDLPSGRAIVLDGNTNTVLFKKDENEKVPIASITKLVTALVFLGTHPDWDSVYTVKGSDIVTGGQIYLRPGESLRLEELFYLSLVGSANSATQALVSASGMTNLEFVAKMNEVAKKLELSNTHFSDPIGLSDDNVSTAEEVATLVNVALRNKYIQEASLTPKYKFTTETGRSGVVYSTDNLLDDFPWNGIRIVGGKTGYTGSAGYCFASKYMDENENLIVTVLLGGPDKNYRFQKTKELVHWVYENYKWIN